MLDADPSQSAPSSPAAEAGPPAGPDRRSTSGETSRQMWRNTSEDDRELERMHHGTPIQCQFCVGQKFRRSRLRGADIRELLLLRYPVRCTRCSQRQSVSFTVAGVSMPSYLRQRDARTTSRRPDPNSASLPATRATTSPEAAPPHTPATDA